MNEWSAAAAQQHQQRAACPLALGSAAQAALKSAASAFGALATAEPHVQTCVPGILVYKVILGHIIYLQLQQSRNNVPVYDHRQGCHVFIYEPDLNYSGTTWIKR